MSCVLCERCSRLIDSDDDPECFIDVNAAPMPYIACERCRDEMEEAGELDVESNTLRKVTP